MARPPRRRPTPRRQRRKRRRPALAVVVVGLLLAGAFAAAMIAGLFTVTRPTETGPFRFPTPVPRAADAAQPSV